MVSFRVLRESSSLLPSSRITCAYHAPGTPHAISAQLRHFLTRQGELVRFSVIQFDSAGNEVGFNEITGLPGDNSWNWQLGSIGVRTSTRSASLKIRFGLIATGDSYLDVDSVRIAVTAPTP